VHDNLQIRTIWKTASEQCEVVWGRFMGYHTRLWVRGRLIVDELAADLDTAVQRAWELRTEWALLVE
jgi:hypothetical protein